MLGKCLLRARLPNGFGLTAIVNSLSELVFPSNLCQKMPSPPSASLLAKFWPKGLNSGEQSFSL